VQSRNCRRQMLFRVTDGIRHALQAVRCCSAIGPCRTRGKGQTQEAIRRLLQQRQGCKQATHVCRRFEEIDGSASNWLLNHGLGAGRQRPALAGRRRPRRTWARAGGGLLLPAVAVLDKRVLVASCSRGGSRRPSPPSTGLGAGRRRPALAGRRRPRQACAGGELLSRGGLAGRRRPRRA